MRVDLPRLKLASRREDAYRVDIAAPDGSRAGMLLLAGAWVLEDGDLVQDVTHWRKRNARMFLTQFEPSTGRTAAWFREGVLARADRVLFFVADAGGTIVGHMGIANWGEDDAELDNVVRGVAGGHPQLMQLAERRLVDWVFEQSAVRAIHARVFSYNWMAQDLHASLGFVPARTLALKKSLTAEMVVHAEVPEAESNVPYGLVVMELRR